MRSKYRKGSLNKTDEAINVALSNAASSSSSATTSTSQIQNSQNNDNNMSSVFNHNTTSSSRKSLISNPTNFQHLQHMGPNDGKLFMHDTNTLVTQRSSHPHNTNTNTSATLQNTSSTSSNNSSINNCNSVSNTERKYEILIPFYFIL